MTRKELSAKVLEFAKAVNEFGAWDCESEGPKTVEIEFDAVWKLGHFSLATKS